MSRRGPAAPATGRLGRLVAVGLVVLSAVLVVAGPFLAPWDPGATVGVPFDGPSAGHPLGTDRLGRDVLSRVLHGGWRLALITVTALAAAYLVGFPAGLLAGLRRSADGWIMRPVDVLVVLPWFLVLAVLATAAGRGAPALVAAGALTALPWMVKVVRGAVLEEASAGYVEAAQARAEPLRRIAFREVAPNIVPVVAADAGMRLTATLSVVTAGGYLGLGLPPNTPDWALDIAGNQGGLTVQPPAVLGPALMIVLLVVSVNLLADSRAARDTPRRSVPVPPRAGDGPDALVARGLSVHDAGGRPLLSGIDLVLGEGRGLAVVGPSGSGKSTLVRAVTGALAPGLRAGGTVRFGGGPGRRAIGWVPQDPALGLSPSVRIGTQVRDVHRAHGAGTGRDAVSATLRGVGLPGDPAFRRRYPHQLSGGQQQRLLLALALVGDPNLLVLDEPTTGLDPGTAAAVLDLVRARRARGVALLVVTHDLAAVRDLVDDVLTVVDGIPAGSQAITPVQAAPAQAAPGTRPSAGIAREPLLRVRGLTAGYRAHPVLDRVDLDVGAGECVGLVGNSGAGKSTLARCLVGLHRPDDGTVTLDGVPLAGRAGARTRAQRGAVQYVFQNPARSLNPRRTVAAELAAPIRIFRTPAPPAVLLDRVGLAADLLDRRTDRLSGGQQQRVALARALAAGPRLLVCDEIVSSLDPANRRAILDLLGELRRSEGLAVLFVSHDHEAVDALADRVLVVDGGTLLPAAGQPVADG
ncbi:ATP-binding cassette domain-containing protein [Pseudonocardia sp. NPDC046786]|uniref:ABC transporter ATP-binding protein/permease n=1 Tax=Pseudonocardia sp. NPDC046786 TaxID=3155471 RepID=UPI0034006753